MKQTYRLTESELHMMIESCVNEALQDEGFLGGLGSLFSKGANKATQSAKNLSGRINNAYQGAKQQVQGAYNNAKQQVQGAYDNAKKTYQAGSYNQDAQKAAMDAKNAIDKLYDLNKKMVQSGVGNNIIGQKQAAALEGARKVLNYIAGQFKATNTARSK